MPTSAAQACQNPSHPSGIGTIHCETCSRWYCVRHAKHPEHNQPLAETPL